MNTRIIGTLLALACVTQSGCTIISHFVEKKKADDAAVADAADKKALDEAVAKKDLGKLKTGCKDTASLNAAQWCQGYQKVFTENAKDMQCDTAWAEFNGAVSDGRPAVTAPMVDAMAGALASCEKWDLYFDDFLPMTGASGLAAMDGRVEKAFLAKSAAGGSMDAKTRDMYSTSDLVLDHLRGLQQSGKAAGSCDDYLAVSNVYADNYIYVDILGRKECKDAVSLFEKGLLSDDGYVRANSCTGLAKVGEAKHVKPLQNLAWTDSFEGPNYSMPVREACRDAFGKLETRLSM